MPGGDVATGCAATGNAAGTGSSGKSDVLPVDEVIGLVRDALDRLDNDRARATAEERLEWARQAQRAADRLHALATVLIGEADRARSAVAAVATPTGTWLTTDAAGGRISRREAAGLVHRGRELDAHLLVSRAAVAGQISAGQATAITGVLTRVGSQLDGAQQARAEQTMLGWAPQMDADALARSEHQLLAAVAPDQADQLTEQRLQREAEQARNDRALTFYRSGGSVKFSGSLPRIDGEAWQAMLDVYAQAQRRTVIEQRDRLAQTPTHAQRYADALTAMIHDHYGRGSISATAGRLAGGGNSTNGRNNTSGASGTNDTSGANQASRTSGASDTGGRSGTAGASRAGGLPRARVLVSLDYAALLRNAAGAGLLPDGQQLSAGEVRRLCCDAEVIPVVLGGPSQVLDVGQATRIVPQAVRDALIVRDQGCAFPACDARPTVCDAHHVLPWWHGGPTALSNMMLLCHHHHGLVEPARHGVRDQWQMRIAPDGTPEAIPPRRIDPDQLPIRHQRYASRDGPHKIVQTA